MNTLSRRSLLAGLAGAVVTTGLPLAASGQITSSPKLIQLNSNENPYGPSAKALQAAREAAARGAYYAMDIRNQFRQAVTQTEQIEMANVVVSTGSNEALCAAVAAWGKQGHILAPSLTYPAHLYYARQTGIEVRSVPLAQDMSIDLDALAAAVNDDTSLVYLCNPNNPTGLPINTQALRSFCQQIGKRCTVLVDEAYNELMDNPAEASVMDLVRADGNLIVTRTFSKVYGLAGMRVGYAMGREDLMRKLAAHVMSWNSHIGVAAALASYEDKAFVDMSRQKIVAGRKIVRDTYLRHGINPLPSATNFIYADIGRDANQFAQAMQAQGVLIRGGSPEYPNWSRVSMGKLEDLQSFSTIFDRVYGAG